MPEQNNTPESAQRAAETNLRSIYRVGEVIVFKYEGNVRAEVTGHREIDGRVWVEARAADLDFLVPVFMVIGTEPREVA